MPDDETVETEPVEETRQGRNWKALRDRAETAEAKVKEYEARFMVTALREAGFDPEQPTGRMVRALYDGPPEKEAILAWAKDKYGLEPETQQPAVAEVAGRLEHLRQQSAPVPPPGGDSALAQRIAELEGKGDEASLLEAIALRDEWRKQQK